MFSKSKHHDVSVIIPTYNYGRFLDDCLTSIYRQVGVNVEIIVVDDGSTDNTQEILAPHRHKIRYIYQENRGPSAARNNGLRVSSGSYIQFLDADDLLGQNSLQAKVKFLIGINNNGVAISPNRIFSTLLWKNKPISTGNWSLFQENLDIHLCRLNIAPLHAFMLPREVINVVGEFNESMRASEDYDYWLKVLGKNYLPQFCAEGMAYYRKHAESAMIDITRTKKYAGDIETHEKKHRGEYGEGVIRSLNTLAGTIAFCDGLICTAIRIDRTVNAIGQDRMIVLVKHYLNKLLDFFPSNYTDLSTTAKIHLSRFLSRKKAIFKLHDEALSELYTMLENKIRLRSFFWHNLKSAFPLNSYDKQFLFYFTLKRITRR